MKDFDSNSIPVRGGDIKFTLPQLLRFVGIRGYTPTVAGAINRALSAKNEIDYQDAMKDATEGFFQTDAENYGEGGWFGQPVYMPVELSVADGFGLDPLYLDSAIVDLRQPMEVVKTQVQGRRWTVKEWIAEGDFEITFSGLLAGRGAYPLEDVVRLKEYMTLGVPLRVSHAVLNALGIHEIVVEEWSLPSDQSINIAPYEFVALSDEPVELRIDV